MWSPGRPKSNNEKPSGVGLADISEPASHYSSVATTVLDRQDDAYSQYMRGRTAVYHNLAGRPELAPVRRELGELLHSFSNKR